MASLPHGFEKPETYIRLVVDTIPTLAWSGSESNTAEKIVLEYGHFLHTLRSKTTRHCSAPRPHVASIRRSGDCESHRAVRLRFGVGTETPRC